MNGDGDSEQVRAGFGMRSAQIIGGGSAKEDLALILDQWAALVALTVLLLGILLLDTIIIGRGAVLFGLWAIEALVIFAWIRHERNSAIARGDSVYSIPAGAIWFGLIAPVLSVFVYPYIVNAIFPPVELNLPQWLKFLAILFSLAFIGWIVYACIVLAIRMWNPNYPAPFSPASPDAGAFQPLGDRRIDGNGEDDDRDRLADIRAMIEELQREPKTKVVTQTPVIIEGRQSNGKPRPKIKPDSDPQVAQAIEAMQPEQAQEQVEHPVIIEDSGRLYVRMDRNGNKSKPVPLELAREFIDMMYVTGKKSFRPLRGAGLKDEGQKTLKRLMVYAGIAAPADGDCRTSVKLVMKRDDALAEFDRIFVNGKPPTLLESDTE